MTIAGFSERLTSTDFAEENIMLEKITDLSSSAKNRLKSFGKFLRVQIVLDQHTDVCECSELKSNFLKILKMHN